MRREELEQLWQNPRHWKSIGFYVCPEDPRLIVPKRPKWVGWTINFAHPWAIPALIGITAIAAGPTCLLVALGVTGFNTILFAVFIPLVFLVVLSIYLSNRTE